LLKRNFTFSALTLEDCVNRAEIDEVIFTKGYNKKVITLKGIAVNKTILSGSSRARYLGINSPNKRITEEEMKRMLSSFNENIYPKRTVLIDANAMLTTLLPIRIVEKNVWGFFTK